MDWASAAGRRKGEEEVNEELNEVSWGCFGAGDVVEGFASPACVCSCGHTSTQARTVPNPEC